MNIYITDKSGKRFFRTSVAAGYSQGERNNMTHRLAAIKSGNPLTKKEYSFIDSNSAHIVEESEPGDC